MGGFVRAAFVLAVVPMLTWGRPVAVCHWRELGERAEVVVKARAEGNTVVGRTVVGDSRAQVEAEVREARLRVERFLKGGAGETELRLRFLAPTMPMGFGWPEAGATRVYFLRRVGEVWEPAERQCLSVVAMAGETEGGVVEELVAVVRGRASVQQKRQALLELREERGEGVLKAVREAAGSAEVDVRLSAVAWLLGVEADAWMEVAAGILMAPPAGASVEVVHNVAAGVGLFGGKARWVPVLVRLMEERDEVVRRAAAGALGRSGSRGAVGVLVRALEGVDRVTRFEAVTGLALILRGALRPTQAEFRVDEWRYVSIINNLG